MSTLLPSLRMVLPDPTHYVHARAFDEIALAVVAGLRRLGVDVELTRHCVQGRARVLVLAPHLQPLERLAGLDRDAILYTWEPLGWSHAVFMTPELIWLMRQFVVWDYSANNLAAWRSHGAARVTHVPMAFDPVLERIDPAQDGPEVDVLFYGSMNDRRRVVLEDIQRRGVNVRWLFGVYGDERDAWIGASRLVLNLHAHDGQILELPRLAYLWANRIPAVVEVNEETEDSLGMRDVMLTAPYDGLAERVISVLADPELAGESTRRCHERFSGLPWMQEVLRAAFAEALAQVS